jgi:preprotein translocase subunit YajC
MSWIYLVPIVVLLAMVAFGQRKRKAQLAQEMVRISQIGFGDEVMTTSGLYGTVVGRNDDGTVQLAIAPGVEVKWAIAALRDAKSLPAQYRKAIHDDDDDGDAAGEADSTS